jgi:integrase
MADKGLTLRTVRHCHAVLRRALQGAVIKGMLASNPADNASPPTTSATRAPETAHWTPEQLATFLDQIRDHYLGAVIRAAAMTGMRRGELCGLRWEDVDLDAAVITVRQSIVTVAGVPTVSDLKSDHSRRPIDLDAETVAVLRRHRVAQLEQRLKAGPGWTDTALVFTNPSGAGWHPDTISGVVQGLIDRSGLPRITLHRLRHSHITHLLVAGVDAKTVSARPGHSSTSFTLDRYGHVLAGRQQPLRPPWRPWLTGAETAPTNHDFSSAWAFDFSPAPTGGSWWFVAAYRRHGGVCSRLCYHLARTAPTKCLPFGPDAASCQLAISRGRRSTSPAPPPSRRTWRCPTTFAAGSGPTPSGAGSASDLIPSLSQSGRPATTRPS